MGEMCGKNDETYGEEIFGPQYRRFRRRCRVIGSSTDCLPDSLTCKCCTVSSIYSIPSLLSKNFEKRVGPILIVWLMIEIVDCSCSGGGGCGWRGMTVLDLESLLDDINRYIYYTCHSCSPRMRMKIMTDGLRAESQTQTNPHAHGVA